jgi:hypothetical protein
MLPPATAGSLKAFTQIARTQAVVKTLPKKKKLMVCFTVYAEPVTSIWSLLCLSLSSVSFFPGFVSV